jgi:hypothetical protein
LIDPLLRPSILDNTKPSKTLSRQPLSVSELEVVAAQIKEMTKMKRLLRAYSI